MQKQPETIQLCAYFSDTVTFIKVILLEFEKICIDEDLNKKFPAMRAVYMHTAIINLAKIFSDSKHQHFSLNRLKNISTSSAQDKINKIVNNHQGIIRKIVNNRNKINAHLDKDF